MKSLICLIVYLLSYPLFAYDFITIQSTTSIRDSGFYKYILEQYKKESETILKFIAVGTGQAIKNSQKCDADLLFVHHKLSEQKFVDNGYGLYRKNVMYNDYILIGPNDDPAGIKTKKNITEAFKIIHEYKHPFVSRGDNSGTYLKEQELWDLSKINFDKRKSSWYRESGSGMGASLNFAVNIGAYILSDRSTWISFGNKKNHVIVFENGPLLVNNYGIIPISPKICPEVKLKEAEEFVNWLTSERGKKLINKFRVNNQQIFYSTNKFIE